MVYKTTTINLRAIPIQLIESGYYLSDQEISKLKESSQFETNRQTKFKEKGTLISESMNLLEEKFLHPLRNIMDNIATNYARNTLGINNKIKRTQSWATLTSKGKHLHHHRHPNSIFNLIYYARANGGEVKFFIDKSSIEDVFYFNYNIREYNIYNASSWKILPKPGDIVIIPGDVMHGVEPNESDQERISIPANYFLTGDIGDKRATQVTLA
tara:strand:- start:956 stop:1594 length:639 start_codon:yes stop_codon:yes gene_type:complete